MNKSLISFSWLDFSILGKINWAFKLTLTDNRQFEMYNRQFEVSSIHFKLYNREFEVSIIHFKLYNRQFEMYNRQFEVYNRQFEVYNRQFKVSKLKNKKKILMWHLYASVIYNDHYSFFICDKLRKLIVFFFLLKCIFKSTLSPPNFILLCCVFRKSMGPQWPFMAEAETLTPPRHLV